MRISSTRYYHGPNRYVHAQGIHHRLRFEKSENFDHESLIYLISKSNCLEKFEFESNFSNLYNLLFAEAHATGVESIAEAAVAFATINKQLQSQVGLEVAETRFFRGRSKTAFNVVQSFESRQVAAASALVTLTILNPILAQQTEEIGYSELDGIIESFYTYARANLPPPEILAFSRRAQSKGIPVYTLDRSGMLQVGQGHRQFRLGSGLRIDKWSLWDQLSRLSGDFLDYLHDSGLPVPRYFYAETNDEIRNAVANIRLPIEIRRNKAVNGTDKSVHIADLKQLEDYLKGRVEDIPVLVIADREANRKNTYRVDRGAEQVGIALHSGTVNSEELHPDNKDLLRSALHASGLEAVYVCLASSDPTQSHLQENATIRSIEPAQNRAEVDRQPSLLDLDEFFADEGNSPDAFQIPVCAITGSNGKTTTSYLTSHILRTAGLTTGLASTYGATINGKTIEKGDLAGAQTARILLQDERLEAAVLETAYGGLSKYGFGPNRCNVGAVINVTSDHVGKGKLHSVDELAAYKSIVVQNARDTAVLNADDLRSLAMIGLTPAKKICLVTQNIENAIVDLHEKQGNPSVRVLNAPEGDKISIYDGQIRHDLCRVVDVPLTFGGVATHNIENVLIATAISFHMGLKIDQIERGLRSFKSTFDQLPGRMNFFDGFPFKVMIDYAHNVEGMSMIGKMLSSQKVKGEMICVITSPGNRPDDKIVELGASAAAFFDRFLVCPEDDLRDREPHEVPNLLRSGMLSAGAAKNRVVAYESEAAAIEAALAIAKSGDLVALFVAGLDHARSIIDREATLRNAN